MYTFLKPRHTDSPQTNNLFTEQNYLDDNLDRDLDRDLDRNLDKFNPDII